MSADIGHQQKRVYAAFADSPQIRLAVETWQQSVLAGGYESSGSRIEDDQIRYLFGDIIRQLVLVGFVVLSGGVVDPEATITWNDEEKAWVANGTTDDDVTVCIFSPPARFGGGDVLTSYGAAAVTVFEKLHHLEQNLMKRDAQNSTRYGRHNPQPAARSPQRSPTH